MVHALSQIQAVQDLDKYTGFLAVLEIFRKKILERLKYEISPDEKIPSGILTETLPDILEKLRIEQGSLLAGDIKAHLGFPAEGETYESLARKIGVNGKTV